MSTHGCPRHQQTGKCTLGVGKQIASSLVTPQRGRSCFGRIPSCEATPLIGWDSFWGRSSELLCMGFIHAFDPCLRPGCNATRSTGSNKVPIACTKDSCVCRTRFRFPFVIESGFGGLFLVSHSTGHLKLCGRLRRYSSTSTSL